MDRWTNSESQSTLSVDGVPLAEVVQLGGTWIGRDIATLDLCSPSPRPTRSQAIEDVYKAKAELLARRHG